MSNEARFRWGRVIVGIIAAEVVPILALVGVVVVYGIIRSAESPTPEEFAPRAGNWVGPIGGFVATFLFAQWTATRAGARPIAHGAAVGVGTAVLDFGLGLLGSGGEVMLVFLLSNAGRIAAGLLGGWVASRRSAT